LCTQENIISFFVLLSIQYKSIVPELMTYKMVNIYFRQKGRLLMIIIYYVSTYIGRWINRPQKKAQKKSTKKNVNINMNTQHMIKFTKIIYCVIIVIIYNIINYFILLCHYKIFDDILYLQCQWRYYAGGGGTLVDIYFINCYLFLIVVLYIHNVFRV